MDFEWDAAKAEANAAKHGATFREAAAVFAEPLSMTAADPDHSTDETRFVTVGASAAGRLLIVAHTDRGDAVRIVSARALTRRERQAYANTAPQ